MKIQIGESVLIEPGTEAVLCWEITPLEFESGEPVKVLITRIESGAQGLPGFQGVSDFINEIKNTVHGLVLRDSGQVDCTFWI